MRTQSIGRLGEPQSEIEQSRLTPGAGNHKNDKKISKVKVKYIAFIENNAFQISW